MNDKNELQDVIMKGIFASEQHRKAWKRKERIIMLIYTGATFFALLFVLLLKMPEVVSPEFEPGRRDFIVYYKIFTVSLFFSLVALGVYFVKSRRSRNRVTR